MVIHIYPLHLHVAPAAHVFCPNRDLDRSRQVVVGLRNALRFNRRHLTVLVSHISLLACPRTVISADIPTTQVKQHGDCLGHLCGPRPRHTLPLGTEGPMEAGEAVWAALLPSNL